MTISVSLDYNEITFNHPILISGDISSITLEYVKNCTTNSGFIDLTSLIGSITNNNLVVPIADINDTLTVFQDGVYYFKLTVVGPLVEGEPGSYVLEGCMYIGTTSRCKALCLYDKTKNESLRFVIKALDLVNDCDDCDCSTQCDLYDYLITLLNEATTTTSNVYSSCGCN